MKKIALILILVLGFLTASAQTEQGSYTLMPKDPHPTVNGYFALDGSYTWVNDYPSGSIGGTIGFTMNHSFSVGLSGAFLLDSSKDPDVDLVIPPGYNIYVIRKYSGYGGMLMEFTLFPKAPIHLTFPMLVGAGGTCYRLQEDNEIWCEYGETLYNKYFFVLTVGARAEVNIVDGFRTSFGASYRYISSDPSLSAFSIDLSFKLGRY